MTREALHEPDAEDGAGDLARVLERNLKAVRGRIASAHATGMRTGTRGTDPPLLVAVTKSVTSSVALTLRRLGVEDLAENRAPALLDKARDFEAAGARARWHFIGPLQSNKARRVVRVADTIHSVDRMSLIEQLDRVAREEEEERRPAVFLEVHLSAEEEKHGFAASELASAVDAAADAEALELVGLMTLAPRPRGDGADGDRARACFAELRRLAHVAERRRGDAFSGGRARLSMGMSGDFVEAVEEGADVVRVGRALFRDTEGLVP